MSRRQKVIVALIFLGQAAGLHAAVPAEPQVEAAYLLGFVETSGCEFYRNGMRYDATQAGSHLRKKYAVLMSSGKPATTDAFIDKVASRSSLTGRPYEVSCAGKARVGTALWLREELSRYRIRRAGS
jgi:Family of unknown function (DUF5329)